MNNINELLSFILPDELDYNGWLHVGMALKHEGYSLDVWDAWSRGGRRYTEGECEKRWAELDKPSGSPRTIATIIDLAKKGGYVPHYHDDDDIEWEDDDEPKPAHQRPREQPKPQIPVYTNKEEGEPLPPPPDGDEWQPEEQIIKYLETLFKPNDIVGYVTETWENEDGKFCPTKGIYHKTRDELIRELRKYKGNLGRAIGKPNENAGAWIRINPLDGEGVSNTNVTDFRYALIECDNLPLEQQYSLLQQLRLPIAVCVYSGGKSVHAVVKVDAEDYSQYQTRVNYLYTVCEKNGLTVDKNNKNPSRMSRMPGVMRNGKKQYILCKNIGFSTYAEWKDYIDELMDELPDIENLADVWDNLPELSDELIHGVVRKGHKLMLAGASKAGKSFALMEMAVAVAEGTEWFGFQCSQGKVLYINLEIDRASCLHRFKNIYSALEETTGLKPSNLSNLEVWNLRGKSTGIDVLVPKIIRRVKQKNLSMIIFDPIYKILTGDENSASDMAKFCNEFDKLCTELGVTVVNCHHHSKGAQGYKKSSDRASGSGVFARDPDAIIDMIELKINDYGDGRTGWRIEGTLREFAPFAVRDVFFKYPIHEVTDELKNCYPVGSAEANLNNPVDSPKDRLEMLEEAFNACKDTLGIAKTADLAAYCKVSELTMKAWLGAGGKDKQKNYKETSELITQYFTFRDKQTEVIRVVK